jgi:hypothetical protein
VLSDQNLTHSSGDISKQIQSPFNATCEINFNPAGSGAIFHTPLPAISASDICHYFRFGYEPPSDFGNQTVGLFIKVLTDWLL